MKTALSALRPCVRTLGRLLLATFFVIPLAAAKGKVAVSRGQITLPTYPWSSVKHPYFRGTDRVNIYPYPMLDFLSRDKTDRPYQTVVLENEFLRITFLPELGGRIHEMINKSSGEPVFYVNHVIKPGLIGQCGAWISGGVEWNTGPQGHTVSCMQPVDFLILPPGEDGSRSVAIGETEKIYRTHWTVVVTLRPGRSSIEERIRIYNPTETIRPYYFWNCTAVPNTPGFRFIYPMTLGTDHGGAQFFHWPVHEGKDLTRGTNYQDASSIFAYGCDQDFFGSYNDDLGRGVVSYANHHQVPGKKAWTWGQGGFGTMHQMDLTDNDGPYNEVQTGPLLTQGEVGRLHPSEAVSWQEWWYPVHAIGGFTYANRDVAVNATFEGGELRLRMMGAGSWEDVALCVRKNGQVLDSSRCAISPRKPCDVALRLRGAKEPFEVELRAGKASLATFSVPLQLPVQKPPEKASPPQTATELAEAGWQDFLFARETEAGARFRSALEKDPKSAEAQAGLAYLNLTRDPSVALAAAKAALEVAPDLGLARFALASCESRAGTQTQALENAWKAALDPLTAVPARKLIARLSLQQGAVDRAVQALSEPGPWQADPGCRSLLAFAKLQQGDAPVAIRLARENLGVDPLDVFAESILWLARPGSPGRLGGLIQGRSDLVLELASAYHGLGQPETALRLLQRFYTDLHPLRSDPEAVYWTAYLAWECGKKELANRYLVQAQGILDDQVAPYRLESVAVFRWALEQNPQDGQAALCLGHLQFHHGFHAEGRELWKKAAELGAGPVVANRALGLACLTVDNNPEAAVEYLEQARAAGGADPIVARDLARVLFTLADKTKDPAQQEPLLRRIRDILQAAFAGGQGRSDFVSLLARAQNRLGEYAETARLLDKVRITIWEGAREAHDLFEEAHLALGEAHLKDGRPAEALAEFDRALEYPANLATGKLENAQEAHIHYLRGNALAALGQKEKATEAWKRAADEPESKDARKAEARKKALQALER